ncbi:MAG: DNA-3-methyladenine glycosylase I, partial [Dongiaceae bacterium]
MSAYCEVAPGHEWHGPYHERHYGFPIADDDMLFERLILEINQAGLSWLTILKRQEAFRKAFREFKIEKVARLGARDVERLMLDASIIRNRMK